MSAPLMVSDPDSSSSGAASSFLANLPETRLTRSATVSYSPSSPSAAAAAASARSPASSVKVVSLPSPQPVAGSSSSASSDVAASEVAATAGSSSRPSSPAQSDVDDADVDADGLDADESTQNYQQALRAALFTLDNVPAVRSFNMFQYVFVPTFFNITIIYRHLNDFWYRFVAVICRYQSALLALESLETLMQTLSSPSRSISSAKLKYDMHPLSPLRFPITSVITFTHIRNSLPVCLAGPSCLRCAATCLRRSTS
jgi:hypothetical protein